jgi:hypothetical protein
MPMGWLLAFALLGVAVAAGRAALAREAVAAGADLLGVAGGEWPGQGT